MKPFRIIIIFVLMSVLGSAAITDADSDRSAGLTTLTNVKEEPRLALVIGNEKYQASSRLQNPVNDARSMSSTLFSLGFKVTKEEDLSWQDMMKAIEDFGQKILNTGGVGLFYYSGHGLQQAGKNYLIPVDADIRSENEIKYKAVDAELVLAKMESAKTRLNIVILDACRNAPSFVKGFRNTGQGLAHMDAPVGTLIAYATSPNRTASDGIPGQNGLYTEELLRYMKTPGLSLSDMFMEVRKSVRQKSGGKQIPWESVSLEGKFYFVADSGSTTVVKPKPPEPEKPKESVLNVSLTTNVSGAEVWLNGKKYGKAPKTFTLSESRTYQVRVTAPGYKPYQIDKEVELGKEYDVSVHLEKERDESEQVQVVTPPPPPGDKTFTNSLGMKFVKIPAGTFTMGSPKDEPGRDDDETQHQVTISKPFFMQTTEVTQGQWKAVMGEYPPELYFKDCGDNCPVERVSWDDIQGFIKKLNQKGEGTYRLPTEAEWEYAARAGTTTPFAFGKCLSTDQANYDGNNPSEGCPKGQYRQKTVPVGSFAPNAWGLYDMHGNVYEWVQDIYSENGVYIGELTDPIYTGSGSRRVFRGGSWSHRGRYCRSAHRSSVSPDRRHADVGFRLSGNE